MIGPERRLDSVKNKLTLPVIGVIAVVLVVYTFARFFLNPNWLEPSPVFSTTYDSATPMPFPVSEPKTMTKLPGRIHSFAVSPDMKAIAIVTSEGVFVYDLITHEQLRALREGENTFSAAFSPDGQKLAVGSLIMQNREAGMPYLVVLDTSTWEILFEPRLGNGDTTMFFGALAWSPNGKFLATSDYGRGLVTFDIHTGNIISTQKDFLMSPYDIAWSPNGSRIVATGDLGYGFRRWRIDTDEAVRLYDPRVAAFATQLAWSPDGKRIASVHADGVLCFWTASTNHCDGYIKAHFLQALSLVWSPDGSQLATGGGVIRIWDTSTGNPLRSFGLIDGSIYSQLEWLANGILISLETGYAEREFTIIRFWNMDTGEIMMEFHGARGIYGE
jgi:WD40 repeat protein